MENETKNEDRSLDALMMSAEVVVTNSRLPEIEKDMVDVGYSLTKLDEGGALYSDAQEHILIREKEFGDQVGATADLDSKKAAASGAYMKTLKLLRIHFHGNSKVEKTLALRGRRKKTVSGWCHQAKVMYGNLLKDPKLLEEAFEMGITEARLQQEIQLIDAVYALYDVQQKEMGEAQGATIARDEALEKLFDWTARYKKIARVVFQDTPQVLEKLGVVVKN